MAFAIVRSSLVRVVPIPIFRIVAHRYSFFQWFFHTLHIEADYYKSKTEKIGIFRTAKNCEHIFFRTCNFFSMCYGL